MKLNVSAPHVPLGLIPVDPVLTARYAAMVGAFAQAVQPTALVSAWLRPHVAEAVIMARYALMVSAFALTAQKNAIISV